MNQKQRERKRLRARFHSVMQGRRERREERNAPRRGQKGLVVIPTDVGPVDILEALGDGSAILPPTPDADPPPTPPTGSSDGGESVFKLTVDRHECWEAAKRRRQSKAKTRDIYQRLMAERGWPDAEPPVG